MHKPPYLKDWYSDIHPLAPSSEFDFIGDPQPGTCAGIQHYQAEDL
jgi:hypothetical protein